MHKMAARPRSAALARFVISLRYQEAEMPMAMERMLPTGRTHLVVNLHEDEFRTYERPDRANVHRTHGAVLAGPRSLPIVIDTREQRCLLMVDFKLGGASPFFMMSMSEAHDQFVELDQLWGRNGAVLRERLLEAPTPRAKLRMMETVLLEHLERRHDPDPAIPFAASAFEYGIPVAKVASRLGWLPKTFVRRFREQIGVSPKRFSRVRRLQRVLKVISDAGPGARAVDWPTLATEHGYTDQAHMIHEFRELTGLTPTACRPRTAREINHVPLASSGR